MYFEHSSEIWRDFPELVPGVLYTEGITWEARAESQIAQYSDLATSRLATASEAEFPEIQAWRRAFSKMGLKPTQYRCASESLLRRFKKEGFLPSIHPLIDFCNAVSLAFATPVAVFDVSQVTAYVQVRYATGSETYLTFGGEIENPTVDEVVFADGAGRAHARRWTNRQSKCSAVREGTTAVLIVAEALHDTAPADMERLAEAVSDGLSAIWSATAKAAILSSSAPRFDF